VTIFCHPPFLGSVCYLAKDRFTFRKEGYVKSLIVFANKLLEDLGSLCQISTARDVKTITRRVEHEGWSFFTITLSDFGKSFEKSLDLGQIVRDHFSPTWGFCGGVPKFLSGFLGLVFNKDTGTLLEEPSIAAIYSIRQFSLAFGKMELDCSKERIQRAKDNYFKCELEVREADKVLNEDDQRSYERIAQLLWRDSFAELDRRLYADEFLPRHGSGSTADRLLGNQKYLLSTWTDRLEKAFPFYKWARFSYKEFDPERVNFHEPGQELPVRVITVPKTLKTPRIIAMEPTHMQYVQQGLLEIIQEIWRRFTIPSAFVCFDSQVPNQELARKGSLTGSLATLDLSEASDRVSYQHVLGLLRKNTITREAVDACRSRKADLDGTKIRLAKFASMGSALCFPFESMVFLTVIFVGIEKSLGYQLSLNDILSFRGSVRVYGDDIVVPTIHVESVKNALETFGFKVNTGKSFWTGKFRESCGKDYYDGVDVSITKLRRNIPNNRSDASELVSLVSTRNQLVMSGVPFPSLISWLDKIISLIIPFPIVGPNSPVLGRHEISGHNDTERMCAELQRPLVRGAVIRETRTRNSVDGYGALLKMALKRGPDPFKDPEHLDFSGRPSRVGIRVKWSPAT